MVSSRGPTPTAFHHPAQGCEARATLGTVSSRAPTLKGLHRVGRIEPFQGSGSGRFWFQGRRSFFAPTLGWMMERRWRSTALRYWETQISSLLHTEKLFDFQLYLEVFPAATPRLARASKKGDIVLTTTRVEAPTLANPLHAASPLPPRPYDRVYRGSRRRRGNGWADLGRV